ncbi:hypothetical protein [Caballeronia sp. AZ10_KS36]|uniref:hypothetical protein n=1 Tax=Caballeronia sp. AZ10_KS36 TaxID=2921757 RepID=UPI00202968F9|nr:hypothetical protein [Caballeronia sp. AZ10_KS36]
MTRKYGAKKDANHAELVSAFKRLGVGVMDLSVLGSGVPDLLIWCAKRYLLVDIKNRGTGYGRRGLNQNQKDWADGWRGGPVYLVYDLDDVVALANGHLDFVKRYPEDRAHPEEVTDIPDGVVYIRMVQKEDGTFSKEQFDPFVKSKTATQTKKDELS